MCRWSSCRYMEYPQTARRADVLRKVAYPGVPGLSMYCEELNAWNEQNGSIQRAAKTNRLCPIPPLNNAFFATARGLHRMNAHRRVNPSE